jgi:hypothetical protein
MTVTISCRNGSVKQLVLGDTGRVILKVTPDVRQHRTEQVTGSASSI